MASKRRTFDLDEAARFVGHRCSKEALRKALVDGTLKGRDMGGRVGWLTTEEALVEFIEKGNATTTTTPNE